MRRLFSIALLVFFLLPYAALPLLGEAEASVPVCCRAGGRHHCMAAMPLSGVGTRVRAVGVKCPAYPKAVVGSGLQMAAAGHHPRMFAGVVVEPAIAAQAEARYRIAWSRSRQKRGPPASSSC